MHQPWASLLIHGIKRIEGRSWPSPITGRLWIHAASKVPEAETIKAMEDFYREIYAVNGITDIKFPEYYPVSRLLGCVEVVGCLKCEELVCWEAVPESVRLEGLTDFCWLCEQPQKLTVPFEMRGYQGVYNLEKRIYDAALRGLRPMEGPQPVKFPLPNPDDRLSLRPGSLASYFSSSKASSVERLPSVNAAIAGARVAATQFSKKDQTRSTIGKRTETAQNQTDVTHNEGSDGTSQDISKDKSRRLSHFPSNLSLPDEQGLNHADQQTSSERKGIDKPLGITQNFDSGATNQNVYVAQKRRLPCSPDVSSNQDDDNLNHVDQHTENGGSGRRQSIASGNGLSPRSGFPSSKLFAAALRGLTLN